MLKTRVILSSLLIAALLGSLLIDLHLDRACASFLILVLAGCGAAVEWNRIMARGCPTYPGLLVAAAIAYPAAVWTRIELGWPAVETDALFIHVVGSTGEVPGN